MGWPGHVLSEREQFIKDGVLRRSPAEDGPQRRPFLHGRFFFLTSGRFVLCVSGWFYVCWLNLIDDNF